jgi:hypothetical protein
MKSILGVSLLILLMPSAYAAALPGDSADGKRLHDANCMGCHDTSIYTRKDRLVLGDCSHMANKEFSASETQNHLVRLSAVWTIDFRHVQLAECRDVNFNARRHFLSRGRTNED